MLSRSISIFTVPVLFAILLFLAMSMSAHAQPGVQPALPQSEIKALLNSNLAFMKSVYEAEYAPKEWKKKYANWDLDQAYNDAVNSVNAMQTYDAQAVKEIVKKFVYSTKDYHVSVRFFGTEAASLPFSVKSAEGKVFLAFIDRHKLSSTEFPFNVGDEVVEFDGKPVNDAITEVQNQIPGNIAETDRAQADMKLTSRKAISGYRIPSGPVTIGIKPKFTTAVQTVQLHWDYTPEQLNSFPGLTVKPETAELKSKQINKTFSNSVVNLQMVSGGALDDLAAETGDENPYMLGAKKSYLPVLGPRIWQADDKNTFDAYIYKTTDRKLIGVIRIPSYAPAGQDFAKAVNDFSTIITLFQTSTDAMVIDQIDNPGGSVSYLYALVSMLSDQPMKAPKHQMSLTQAEVQTALDNLARIETITDDDSAVKVLGSNWDGFAVNYQVAQFLKGYEQFIVSEWNKGKTLTDPYYIEGADQINPNAIHYTKPILVVVNELCFSGGDFFPATLQDNKRASIFGVRTAGAGGYVKDVSYPNALGIQSFRVTESIAERVNLDPIENLGVKPDIAYTLKASDLQYGFSEYAAAIRTSVEAMVK